MTEQQPNDPYRQAPQSPAPYYHPGPPYPPAQSAGQYPPAQYPSGQYPYPVQVAPKNAGLSVLASFFIPGLGSMINGDVGKGIAILVGYLVSCVLVIVLIGLVGVFGFWVWGMVDAYQGAQKWNAAHGIVS